MIENFKIFTSGKFLSKRAVSS
jgi:hypothetical protein